MGPANDGSRPRQYNKFFDSLSVRYLYRPKERHIWYPESDRPSDVQVDEETTASTGAQLGLATAGSIPIPAPEVHIQKDRKLVVSRKMHGWRKGVSMEQCQSCTMFICNAKCF